MADRDRSWLRDLADLSNIIQLLLYVGGLGILAFAAQWISAAFFSLSGIERVVLAVLVFFLALGILLTILRMVLGRRSVTNPGDSKADAPQQDTLTPYPPVQDHELPHLLATRWVQGRSLRIEQFVRQGVFKLRRDVSVQLNQMRFIDCEIYGPAILTPVESPIGGKTFVNCSWDEEPWHRWKGSSEGRYYVGAIRLQDCVFQGCHFRGVGLVLNPDEYDKQMEGHDSQDVKKVPYAASEETTEAPELSESRPGDEHLRHRSLQLSQELNRFLKERAEQDPQAGIFSKEARLHHQETISQYGERFAGPVGALFGDLELRGWCESKERRQFENPLMVLNIQHIANRLAAIGHKS